MSTPLKALIQERLRAKMERREADCEADALQAQAQAQAQAEAQMARQQQREDDGELLMAAGYPTRMRTHVESSAYLVPSQIDTRCFLSPTAYATDVGSNCYHDDGTRIRYRRYGLEKPRTIRGYNNASSRRSRHQRQQRQMQYTTMQEELAPKPSTTLPSPTATWRHREVYHTDFRGSKTPSSRFSSPPCGYGKNDANENDQHCYLQTYEPEYSLRGGYSNNQNSLPSPLPSPEYTQAQPQTQTQMEPDFRFDWGDSDREREQRRVFRTEEDEASPVRHHYAPFYPAPRISTRHSHPNQLQDESEPSQTSAKARPPQPQPQPQSQCARQLPSPLDMTMVQSTQPRGRHRMRSLGLILSPESRQAAKAFVEKRQRRADKGTPRTMATQRWLQKVDSAVMEPEQQQMRC